MPIIVRIAPRPLIPFLPRIINKPDIANTMSAPAKMSENMAHHLPGL